MSTGSTSDPVLIWQVPVAGTVQITGTSKDSPAACPAGGDGVVVSITKKTGPAVTTLWQETILDGDTAGKSHSLTQNVVAGDRIYFAVNKGPATNTCDTTQWDPKITYTAVARD